MSTEDVGRARVAVVVKRLVIAESRLSVETDQVADDEPLSGPLLTVNSLGLLGMLLTLEDELGVRLPDDLFAGRPLRTVADLVDVVARCVR